MIRLRHRLAVSTCSVVLIGFGAAAHSRLTPDRAPDTPPLSARTLHRAPASPAVTRTAAPQSPTPAQASVPGTPRLDRVLDSGAPPPDARLGPPVDLDHPFTFTPDFTSKAAWLERAATLRRQTLVALGLWPLPARTPLNPVIHGRIDRDDYTIEKVFFASYPGHYVSGNLYRPKGNALKNADGRRPAALSPHGHWENGRLFERTPDEARKQVEAGGEQMLDGGRYPNQARCAMLARLGFIVFQWDMVGYADSTQIPHRAGFTDTQALLHQQSFMGLQAWNTIRALDFIAALPDVDPSRLVVTGESGGATQTIMLDAIDDRPAAAFPAVMVSGAMQGGCICENAPLLRIGTNNIELAALFAPKPLGMSAANDWTRDLLTLGLPELKKIYALFGADDKVAGRHFPYEHNFNQLSREMMYNWFNTQLDLGLPSPIAEKPFVPATPAELSVYDAAHPRPADASTATTLRAYLTRTSNRQMNALAARPAEYRDIVRSALEQMVGDRLPTTTIGVRDNSFRTLKGDGFDVHQALLTRTDNRDALPAAALLPTGWRNGPIVIWAHPAGKSSLFEADAKTPTPAVRWLLTRGAAVLSGDLFLTGELTLAGGAALPAVKDQEKFAGYNYGYNRTVLANRVHDLLTLVRFAQNREASVIHLIAFDKAGVWGLLARSLAGDAIAHASLDLASFDFDRLTEPMDPMMLPGALKYGGIHGLLPLADHGRTEVYRLTTPPASRLFPETSTVTVRAGIAAPRPEAMARWLLSSPPASGAR